MTKLLAYVTLVSAGTAIALGNYWYTFGLWPRSWVAFFGFWAAQVVVLVMHTFVTKEE